MRILLIAPPFKRFTGLVSNYLPLGLAYLAAVVKRDDHEVKIFEADAAVKPTSLDFTDEYRRYDLYLRGVNDLGHPVQAEIRQLIAKAQASGDEERGRGGWVDLTSSRVGKQA